MPKITATSSRQRKEAQPYDFRLNKSVVGMVMRVSGILVVRKADVV